jgi:hypothetical protein
MTSVECSRGIHYATNSVAVLRSALCREHQWISPDENELATQLLPVMAPARSPRRLAAARWPGNIRMRSATSILRNRRKPHGRTDHPSY